MWVRRWNRRRWYFEYTDVFWYDYIYTCVLEDFRRVVCWTTDRDILCGESERQEPKNVSFVWLDETLWHFLLTKLMNVRFGYDEGNRWMYRIRPAVVHQGFTKLPNNPDVSHPLSSYFYNTVITASKHHWSWSGISDFTLRHVLEPISSNPISRLWIPKFMCHPLN